MAARALPGRRRGAEPRARAARGGAPARRDHPERHHQGVPLPRDLRLPAGALAAADLRRHLLHRQRDPEVEPDQHLQLSPAGGRGDADAGARLRADHRDRRARRGQGRRPGRPGRLREGRRPDLVLRQRRRPVHRGDLQDAGVRRAVGRDHPRALRRPGPQDAPLPLRRAGQLARPDRGPAGEQRPADRARDARRHPVQERPRARRTAAGVERGPRPAASLGPAVVAAPAAGAGLRVRPAGVRRHLRRLEGDRGQGRPARRGRPRGDRPGAGTRRSDRGRRVRLHEAGAGQLPLRPSIGHRERPGHRRRGEQVRDHRALAADRGPRRRDPGSGPRGRALGDRRPGGLARGA